MLLLSQDDLHRRSGPGTAAMNLRDAPRSSTPEPPFLTDRNQDEGTGHEEQGELLRR